MNSTANQPQPCSQHGEDLLVWDYCGGQCNGFFIQVGANHLTDLSLTWWLEQRGGHGLLVDPLPGRCAPIRAARPNSIGWEAAAGAPNQVDEALLQVTKADAWSRLSKLEDPNAAAEKIRVQVRPLDSFCDEPRAPQVDFLAIDVAGMEVQVLAGLDLARRRPALVLLEDHLNGIDQELCLRRAGYRLIKRTGCNNWGLPARAKRPPRPLPRSSACGTACCSANRSANCAACSAARVEAHDCTPHFLPQRI